MRGADRRRGRQTGRIWTRIMMIHNDIKDEDKRRETGLKRSRNHSQPRTKTVGSFSFLRLHCNPGFVLCVDVKTVSMLQVVFISFTDYHTPHVDFFS